VWLQLGLKSGGVGIYLWFDWGDDWLLDFLERCSFYMDLGRLIRAGF
jgi:hypothetical protein